MAVLGLTGEVDGYIYLGQQTPAFYAKQVVASLLKYGRTLLPPFFGGLMAYDGEANIAFDCPGHQGGQFYQQVAGRAALLQIFRRERLPQRSVQCRRRPRRSADPRGPRRGGAALCSAGIRRRQDLFRPERHEHVQQGGDERRARRGDLVLFDRNNHKSLHQGALVQAGAIPIFLPTSRNPFGMIGAVDWDAWDEDYLREQIRANPLVKDPAAAQSRASVPARMHPARDL